MYILFWFRKKGCLFWHAAQRLFYVFTFWLHRWKSARLPGIHTSKMKFWFAPHHVQLAVEHGTLFLFRTKRGWQLDFFELAAPAYTIWKVSSAWKRFTECEILNRHTAHMRAETKPAILHVLYVEPKGDRNQKGIYPSYEGYIPFWFRSPFGSTYKTCKIAGFVSARICAVCRFRISHSVNLFHADETFQMVYAGAANSKKSNCHPLLVLNKKRVPCSTASCTWCGANQNFILLVWIPGRRADFHLCSQNVNT